MWTAEERAALVAAFTGDAICADLVLDRIQQTYLVATLGGALAGATALGVTALVLIRRRRRRDRRV